jgi:hypothetical protein
MDQKVEVITEFLENRARAGQTTTFNQIRAVAGVQLLLKGYRTHSTSPVSAEDTGAALAQIAQDSYQLNGFLLPAVVVKASAVNEGLPNHYFADWANSVGLIEGTLESCEDGPVREAINDLAPAQRAAVFTHYGAPKFAEVAQDLELTTTEVG